MNIIIFGRRYDIMRMIQLSEHMQYRLLRFTLPDSVDEYLSALRDTKADIIFVAAGGARGMEAAIAAHDVCPDAALVWFADDEAFGAQSYRINCRFFTSKNITADIVENALMRCIT